MFREFVHSRAMENAVPTIRRMAEKVIESNRKNGVAKEINQILGGLEYGIFGVFHIKLTKSKDNLRFIR